MNASGLPQARQCRRRARRIGGFLLRHSLATGAVVVTAVAVWTVVYLGLLLWAMIGNRRIGGPLAYPAGLVVVLGAGLVVCLGLLLPATAFAEWLAGRCRWPVLAQIPLSLLTLALLCLPLALISAADHSEGYLALLVTMGILFAGALIPLGIYWWIAQSGPLIASWLDRWKARIRAVF